MTTTTEGGISVVRSKQGHTVQVLTDLHCGKITGDDTGGAYSLAEVTVLPGCGTPLHRHRPAETFYVLQGEFSISRGDHSELRVGAGDTVHIPGDEPHGYRNIGASTGRFLAILAPSGMDAFFEELGTPAPGATEPAPLTGPPDMERVLAVTAKHNVEMLL
jgi:quercetin dioxygenase-like cupin family protein